jgi:CheY-like chemotaxis protein
LILVIDDEQMILNMTQEMLGSYGYQTLIASNGKEGSALYAGRAQSVDAVMVDMMMPQMDGHATIQALRRINPKVKILAMSGVPHEGGDDPVRGMTQNFLPKPFSALMLLKALRDLLPLEPEGRGTGSGENDKMVAA